MQIGLMLNRTAGKLEKLISSPKWKEWGQELSKRVKRFAITGNVEEANAHIEDFYSKGVDLVVLVGGDETVGNGVDTAIKKYGVGDLPRFIFGGGGRMNTIKKSLESEVEKPLRIKLRRLIKNLDSLRKHGIRDNHRLKVVRHNVLRIDDGINDSDLYRFIYGEVFAARLVQKWEDEKHLRGLYGAFKFAAKLIYHALFTEYGRDLLVPTRLALEVNGKDFGERDYNIVVASTIKHSGPFLKPFYRAGGKGGKFHLWGVGLESDLIGKVKGLKYTWEVLKKGVRYTPYWVRNAYAMFAGKPMLVCEEDGDYLLDMSAESLKISSSGDGEGEPRLGMVDGTPGLAVGNAVISKGPTIEIIVGV